MGHETTAEPAAITVEADHPEDPGPRQCGRCREFFSVAPAHDPTLQATWWLCPACRTKFFGTP
ncbi:MAG TPA: hypothetical protein VHY77_04955 [Acidimicrobiales bacterium]|nr:hypothetical protein [Acidimicrobiales bacterium]